MPDWKYRQHTIAALVVGGAGLLISLTIDSKSILSAILPTIPSEQALNHTCT